ncbi:uncharacterized conserved protein involved in intracellular sulfur reduction [Idiomarina sp. A28L]|uniref:DsrE family protein n=1 Tax=Idiomarina sp. A28L TaxID=1036674 RepID=UPI00021388FD|nr:DsrE family protein [Idiomarina sp. A28L]EGN75762.1 uncharacterized conserved protein involved in intracellular sulfur reduction [Idiomarina sp. A28L]
MVNSSYVIMLQAAPDDYLAGQQALQCAQDLVTKGNQLKQVFFYGPAVIYANQFLQGPSGAPNLQEQWRKFSTENNIPLVVCATVGSQYGLEALPPPAGNLAEGFVAGGLAEFIETLAKAEHFLQFQGSGSC